MRGHLQAWVVEQSHSNDNEPRPSNHEHCRVLPNFVEIAFTFGDRHCMNSQSIIQSSNCLLSLLFSQHGLLLVEHPHVKDRQTVESDVHDYCDDCVQNSSFECGECRKSYQVPLESVQKRKADQWVKEHLLLQLGNLFLCLC